ncbi:MAG: RHS repeat-associated core domain-containing protein [Tahibacter sp.]
MILTEGDDPARACGDVSQNPTALWWKGISGEQPPRPDGTVVTKRMRYEPYGRPTDDTYTDKPGYTGHVADSLTKLSYMQQRYYDPQLGRFLSVDPIKPDPGTGAGDNRYAYASDNPFKYYDPHGRCTGSHISTKGGTCVSSGEQTAVATSAKGNLRELSPAQIAVAVRQIDLANKKSIKEDAEYGGLGYKSGNRTKVTTPVKQKCSGSDCDLPMADAFSQVRSLATILFDWHVHGDVPSGMEGRYNFSLKDLEAIDAAWTMLSEQGPSLYVGGFVGTTSGFIRFYRAGSGAWLTSPFEAVQTIRKGVSLDEEHR